MNHLLRFWLCMAGCLWAGLLHAQIINTATMDTSEVDRKGKVTVGGYIDAYYGFDMSEPASAERKYFITSNRHNELSINLGYIDIRYTSEKLRGHFVPGFGTYCNANYTDEPGTLKSIIEGYVGVRISDKKPIWVDVGVLGSPYTNESAISKDHLMYTRSFAPEYVPYYLSGAKLTYPISDKVTGSFYLLNGWQVIQDNNNGKSVGTQIEYRPAEKWLFNWNTYTGDERSQLNPQNRMRYFSDVFFLYNMDGKWSATGCAYVGVQERIRDERTQHAVWWQANVMGRYKFNPKSSLSGRLEYFSDPETAIITAQPRGFSSYSTGLCFNRQISKNAVFRTEYRVFYSEKPVYEDVFGQPAHTNQLAVMNLTIWY